MQSYRYCIHRRRCNYRYHAKLISLTPYPSLPGKEARRAYPPVPVQPRRRVTIVFNFAKEFADITISGSHMIAHGSVVCQPHVDEFIVQGCHRQLSFPSHSHLCDLSPLPHSDPESLRRRPAPASLVAQLTIPTPHSQTIAWHHAETKQISSSLSDDERGERRPLSSCCRRCLLHLSLLRRVVPIHRRLICH
jgi:hypothetical protein